MSLGHHTLHQKSLPPLAGELHQKSPPPACGGIKGGKTEEFTQMKHWLTTPKLIIAVLIALTAGFVLHGRSKAQPTLETHADLPEIDRRLITEFEGRPTEPGEPEPPLSGFMQHAQDAFSLLNTENNTERRLVSTLPTQPALLANYPNPFNPETWIPYQLAQPAEVKVSIFAADGTLVRTLALGSSGTGYIHE